MKKNAKNKSPIIFGMVGLVGAGMTTVSQKLAKLIDGKAIEKENLLAQFRKENISYQSVWEKMNDMTLNYLVHGKNVVLDCDLTDKKHRELFINTAKKTRARFEIIRVYADRDIQIGRIISARYINKSSDFFGGASTKWQGRTHHGAVVKMREMWRKTPMHYKWENVEGGKWHLKKLPFKILAQIDTSDSTEWQKKLEKLVCELD
jgi:predicted kinase